MNLYSIGEAARRVGRSEGTLRRWEREGRVKPRRTSSGRVYTERDIKILRRIASASNTPDK